MNVVEQDIPLKNNFEIDDRLILKICLADFLIKSDGNGRWKDIVISVICLYEI